MRFSIWVILLYFFQAWRISAAEIYDIQSATQRECLSLTKHSSRSARFSDQLENKLPLLQELSRNGFFTSAGGRGISDDVGQAIGSHERRGFRLFDFTLLPEELQEAHLIYLKFIHNYGVSQEGRAGVVFQFRTLDTSEFHLYAAFDFRKIPSENNNLHIGFLSLMEQYTNFFSVEYKKQLKMEHGTANVLSEISKSLKNRSILICRFNEPIVITNQQGGRFFRDLYTSDFERVARQYAARAKVVSNGSYAFPSDINILGGGVIVTSKNTDEKLPMEIFLGITIPREKGEIIAEVGRYTVVEGLAVETTPRVLQQLAAVAKGANVKKLYIEADELRARRFKLLGFRVLPGSKRLNYAGKVEYILEADVGQILNKIMIDSD